MPKKKAGKHLLFYMYCMKNGGIMPVRSGLYKGGLCLMAESKDIDQNLLDMFAEGKSIYHYWADESSDTCANRFIFNELRQTIVLLMAAINNEL